MNTNTYLLIGVFVAIIGIPILCIIVALIRACLCKESRTNENSNETRLEIINEEYTEIILNK